MIQVPIKRAVERVPGGLMVVPLSSAAFMVTPFPDTPRYFGSFTGARFTGASTILAVFVVCIGASAHQLTWHPTGSSLPTI
jgi:2-keto-3-deoxygluconate permease